MALAERLPELDALETLRRESGLTTVVVRLDEMGPPQRPLWLSFAAHWGRHELRLMAREGNMLLFAVRPWVVPPHRSG
jgi:hypothetical protein